MTTYTEQLQELGYNTDEITAIERFYGADVLKDVAGHHASLDSFELLANCDGQYVVDYNGKAITFEHAMRYADPDIMEEIDEENPQKFIETYAQKHEEKYGEDFAPYYGGAW